MTAERTITAEQVADIIDAATGPTGGWLISPKKLQALVAEAFAAQAAPSAATEPGAAASDLELLGALAAAKIALRMFTNTPADSDSERRMVFRMNPADFLQIRTLEQFVGDTLKAREGEPLTSRASADQLRIRGPEFERAMRDKETQ